MAEENLVQLSTEELKKKAKFMKLAVGMIAVAMALMAISGIILSIRKGFSALSVTPIAFLPLMIIFSSQLTKINTELKRRTH